MNIEKYGENLKTSIDWINGLDVDENIRLTVKRACSAELLEIEEEMEEAMLHERQGRPWTKNDLIILEKALCGKIADSFHTEKHNILQAALRLRRKEKGVKRKAIEMGYGRAVDYWINREC